jgi:hypothetical protein
VIVPSEIQNPTRKLKATNFEVKKGSTEIIKKEYQFLSDGSLKYAKDDINAKFDRLYRYDFAGIMTTDAIGGGPPTLQKQVSNEERSLLKALAATRKPAPWDNETDIVPESPDIPGSDASLDSPIPEATPPVDPDNKKPVGEVTLESKLKGRWVYSPEAQKRLDDCLSYATDDYVEKVDTLNSESFRGWIENSAIYVASTFGIPTALGTFKDALKAPGAMVTYGWGTKITVNGTRIKPRSLPGGRVMFYANFTLQTGIYIHTQRAANRKDAALFDEYTSNFFAIRDNCFRSNLADTYLLEP